MQPGSSGDGNTDRRDLNLLQDQASAAAALQFQQMLSDHSSQSAMDEFLDNIISIPAWSEVGSLRSQWDYNATSSTSSENEMLVVPFQSQLGVSALQTSSSDLASMHESIVIHGSSASMRSISEGSSQQNQQLQKQQQAVLHDDHVAAAISQAPSSWFAPSVLPLSLAKSDASSDLNGAAKKRYRDEEQGNQTLQAANLGRDGAQVYGAPSTSVGQMQQQQSSQGQTYDSSAPPAPPAIVRPRVRARRGQATDPHSIAERLRRERIAERMKALQELVPNANKTDKASMLDEIIDYVKFLQLQVKVLSMSRLGSVGSVAPLVADLPPENSQNLLAASLSRTVGQIPTSQEGIALTECQVARLMEEDMGSAMQYLQSKGLCLMPISLATSISTNARPPFTANAQPAEEAAASSSGLSATTVAAKAKLKLVRSHMCNPLTPFILFFVVRGPPGLRKEMLC